MFFQVLPLIISCWILLIEPNEALNNRPIIGVMEQGYVGKIRPSYNYSFIAASYVKYLESAGARVVPVHVNQTESYYTNIFNWTNGILFPGGGEPYYDPLSSYGNAGKLFFKMAKEANDRGDYYPIWGTCLGFELLNFVAANNKNWMTKCSANDMADPLTITPNADGSKLFNGLTNEVKKYLITLPVTVYYHHWCFTLENYTKSGLNDFFRVLSVHNDTNNLTYVSTIEAKSYPFYATAYHPEKNVFEFVIKPEKQTQIPHSFEAVRVTQDMANFFVNEARKSLHSFPDSETEQNHLIYNYQTEFVAKQRSSFEQYYFFEIKEQSKN